MKNSVSERDRKQGITSFWGLFFPFGIILGMRFGMFTPSEGGAVAVLYCIIIGRFVLQETIPERASGSDPASTVSPVLPALS